MLPMLETSFNKATQALNLLAQKKDGKINKMKAIKLIYLADRLHLRKYGRPIVGDIYWAMKLGPVGSRAKSIAELSEDLPREIYSYAKKYIKPDEKKQSFISLRPPEFDLFSKTDIECLEFIYEEFSDKDQFELADLTHEYFEWLKHKRELATGKKRVKMFYEDFFVDYGKDREIFSQDKEGLALAKEAFEESKEVDDFFS